MTWVEEEKVVKQVVAKWSKYISRGKDRELHIEYADGWKLINLDHVLMISIKKREYGEKE